MPVLRYSGDTSIGQSLGNIGSALGQALDPKLRAQAQMLQIEMQLHLLQMRELQRKFGARDDLKHIYSSLPPDRQAKFNYMIEHDVPMSDIEKEVGLQALTDPSSDQLTPQQLKNNIQNTIRLTGQPYDKTYGPIVGPSTMGAATRTQQQQQYETERAKASGTAAGGGITTKEERIFPLGPAGTFQPQGFDPVTGQPTNVAPIPGASPVAPPAQTPPVSPAAQAAPASSGSTANITSGQSGGTLNVSSGGAGTAVAAGGGGLAGGSSGGAGIAGTLPSPVRNLPGGGQVTGYNPVDVAASGENTKINTAELTNALEGGPQGYRTKATIEQIRQLAPLAQNEGPWGAAESVAGKWLAERGVIVTNSQEARARIKLLLNGLIPNVRQEAGVTRVAQPEIKLLGNMIGSEQMPWSVLSSVLNGEDALADIQIQNYNNANRVLGRDKVNGPMDMADYTAAKTGAYSGINDKITDLNAAYGHIHDVASAPGPSAGGGGWLDPIARLFAGGNPSQAPAPSAAPAAPVPNAPAAPAPAAPPVQAQAAPVVPAMPPVPTQTPQTFIDPSIGRQY